MPARRIVGKRRSLTPKEADFVRLVSMERLSSAAAYRRAYGYHGRHADTLSNRLRRMPHIEHAIEDAEAAMTRHDAMSMRDRREILSRIAGHKSGWNKAPSYGDRVSAIREDAILAGERRLDGSQGQLSAEVSVHVIIGALSAHAVKPVRLARSAVVSIDPEPASPPLLPRGGGATPEDGSTAVQPSPARPGASILNPLGPVLGNGRGNGHEPPVLESWDSE